MVITVILFFLFTLVVLISSQIMLWNCDATVRDHGVVVVVHLLLWQRIIDYDLSQDELVLPQVVVTTGQSPWLTLIIVVYK